MRESQQWLVLSSSLNLPAWEQKLTDDLDRTFLLDSISNGFQLLPEEASLSTAEQANYFSATAPHNQVKVEQTIRME